MKTENLQP